MFGISFAHHSISISFYFALIALATAQSDPTLHPTTLLAPNPQIRLHRIEKDFGGSPFEKLEQFVALVVVNEIETWQCLFCRCGSRICLTTKASNGGLPLGSMLITL